MNRAEEQIILERIKSGEESLYNALIEHYSSQLFSVVTGVVQNREDAQEIVQDAFTKAYFSLNKFRGDSSFSTWVFRIAYNMAISKVRKKKRYVNVDQIESFITGYHTDDDSQYVEKEAKYSMIDSLLSQLPPDERFIILSFYMEEKGIREIAQITGKSETNIKVKLFRIRQKLQNDASQIVNLQLESNG